MSISDRLQMVIKMNGMTNASFADTIGVQRSSISHVLSGRNKPSIDFIQKILDTFPKVDANWLVAGRKVGKAPDSSEKQFETTRDKEEDIVVEDEEVAPYFKKESTQTKDLSAPSPEERKVEKVIVFFTDGTFEELGKASG